MPKGKNNPKPRPLFRWVLRDRSGHHRGTCSAPDIKEAAVAFFYARKGHGIRNAAIPQGWAIIQRERVQETKAEADGRIARELERIRRIARENQERHDALENTRKLAEALPPLCAVVVEPGRPVPEARVDRSGPVLAVRVDRDSAGGIHYSTTWEGGNHAEAALCACYLEAAARDIKEGLWPTRTVHPMVRP